jgi:hypothetical protein
MHILASFCNIRAPAGPALGLLDAATWDFQVLELPAEIANYSGFTGLAQCERYVYVAAQPSDSLRPNAARPSSVLFVFNRHDLSLAGHYSFQSGTDIHSLLAHEGRLYAVSTGTDEVIELRLRNAEVISENCFWRLDTDVPREDIHHLNAISLWGDDLVISAFGRKASGRWHSARDGFIRNISRGETLAHGLDQPHSLADFGLSIGCCESRQRAVRVLGDQRVQHLPGYTRGMCLLDQHLFVATSMGRQVSRSTGLTNNPADDGLLGGQCTINRLSIATFDVEHTIDLGAYAQEIYDLLPVDDAAVWPVVDEIAWRNSSIRELASLLDQRTNWAKQLTTALAQRDSTIAALHEQNRGASALQNEVVELRQTIRLQTEQGETIRGANDALQRDVAELRAAIDRQTAQAETVRHSNEALHGAIGELRTIVERQGENVHTLICTVDFWRRIAVSTVQQWAPDSIKKLDYFETLSSLRKTSTETLPTHGTVAVVSKGDDEMLKFVGQNAWHFPQTLTGVYAGAHPLNSLAAIAHIEALRMKGADFLLFPSTAFWWLEHYAALKDHLQRRYRVLVHDDACAIFDLREALRPRQSDSRLTIEHVIDECESRLSSSPAILDWNSGLELARSLSQHAVFSPPSADLTLPYLDRSVDVVVVPCDSTLLDEARRVAGAAVVTVSGRNGAPHAALRDVEWQMGEPEREPVTVSIIISPPGDSGRGDRYLAALQASLPDNFKGEIIHTDMRSSDGGTNPARDGGGYAAERNRAASIARGDVLVFLGRLTIPLEGWLAPLLDTLRSQPRAGAVGSKILSADARIDQAGGIVFSDASLAGFGNGDYKIDDPLYGYLRDVDYSGESALATTKLLFEEIGGFDRSYQSTAYVHADYCFRAREHGYRTCYQCDSVLVSLPETYVRTATAMPFSADPAGDRKLFGRRWQQALKRQPLARDWRDRDTWHALAVCGRVSEEKHR